MLCAKFGWNWQMHGSGEEDFWISWMYFPYFLIISPWKYGEALNLNKPESPSPKNALCQVLLKLAQRFWRRRFLNFVNLFSLFLNYLPLEKGGALHLNKLEHPSPKDALCKFGWNCPSGSEEEDEIVKSLRQRHQGRRRQRQQLTTGKFWSEKLIWAFG